MSEHDDQRASRPGAVPALPELTEAQVAEVEARNGLRQYDRMMEMIAESIAPQSRPFRLRPSAIMELNRIAVQDLLVAPGAFREGPVTISGTEHQPPPHPEVPGHIDDMCQYVEDHASATPVHLSSYVMWRLNWIHPFTDGNGRTSRAVSYLVLCASLKASLPGSVTIPERIAQNKQQYYAALDEADAGWKLGHIDLSLMETTLGSYLAAQLVDVLKTATGRT